MSLVNPIEHHSGSTSGQPGLRVRDLLRLHGASRNCCERAALMAQVAVELNNAANDIAADPTHAQQHRDVIARLRGQADMARLAGRECAEHARERHQAC